MVLVKERIKKIGAFDGSFFLYSSPELTYKYVKMKRIQWVTSIVSYLIDVYITQLRQQDFLIAYKRPYPSSSSLRWADAVDSLLGGHNHPCGQTLNSFRFSLIRLPQFWGTYAL